MLSHNSNCSRLDFHNIFSRLSFFDLEVFSVLHLNILKLFFVGVLSGNPIKCLNHLIWHILIVYIHGFTCFTLYTFSLLTFLGHIIIIHAVLNILCWNESITFFWCALMPVIQNWIQKNACYVAIKYASAFNCLWWLKVFHWERYILSFWLMLLLTIFFVKCPNLFLIDYLIVQISALFDFKFFGFVCSHEGFELLIISKQPFWQGQFCFYLL